MKKETEMKKKRKKRMGGCLIVLLVIILIGSAVGIGWYYMSREDREIANLPLDAIDFSNLIDGTYQGEFEGGMFKRRANECEVIVSGGQVTDINLVSSKDEDQLNGQLEMLYDQVIKSQSLQVDTVSGATISSNAYLQAVENALLNAQN